MAGKRRRKPTGMCDKAGNAGDVLKHSLLGWFLGAVPAASSIIVVETHAGPGRCVFPVTQGDRARGHLLKSIQSLNATGWTAPYLATLQAHVRLTGATVDYPGSPVQIIHHLRQAKAECLFFEKNMQAYGSLTGHVRRTSPAAAIFPCAGSWRGPPPSRPSVRNMFSLGLGLATLPATPPYDFIFCHLDPWMYRRSSRDGSLVTQQDLAVAVQWARQLASDGLVAVWTWSDGSGNEQDLKTDLGAATGNPASLFQITSSSQARTPYAWSIAGIGSVGAGAVSKIASFGPSLPDDEPLKTWGFHVKVS